MSYSDYRKAFKQLKAKPVVLAKFKKHNSPGERSCGFLKSKCRRCGRVGRGYVGKYGIGMCRQCFREVATKLGFKKYS